MLRMVRVAIKTEDWIERTLSESGRVGLRTIGLILTLLGYCHLVCCLWFAIGRGLLPTNTGRRWTEVDIQGTALVDADITYQYISSFHWAVAQFMLENIEIECVNAFERLFSIICLLIGLIFGSVIISSLSASMVNFQMIRQEYIKNMRLLRQYLRENAVNRETALLVQQ